MNERVFDPFPLEKYRGRWSIEVNRDGIHMVSALRQPTPTSIVYFVAHTAEELAALIERFEATQEKGGQS